MTQGIRSETWRIIGCRSAALQFSVVAWALGYEADSEVIDACAGRPWLRARNTLIEQGEESLGRVREELA
jgi:hypothetical protein